MSTERSEGQPQSISSLNPASSAGHESFEQDPLELLADKYAKEVQEGRNPSIDDYVLQMPDRESEIRELFPAVLLMEKIKKPESDAGLQDSTLTPAAPPKLTGKKLGSFVLLREIGRGGMGIVYQAIQQGLDRRVALKVMNPGSITTETQLKRFRREVRLAANLHHNHIVPVFSVGQDQGHHFYSMQYIDGIPLDRWISGQENLPDPTSGLFHQSELDSFDTPPSDPNSQTHVSQETDEIHSQTDGSVDDDRRSDSFYSSSHSCDQTIANGDTKPDLAESEVEFEEGSESFPRPDFPDAAEGVEEFRFVARIGIQIAKALAYAHSRGILHRDIKPHNLLLDQKQNVWVTDFGLAKLHGENDITQSANIVGTLRYMAPEQIQGKATKASDLYSFGLTLFEMLTRQPAFQNLDGSSILEQRLRRAEIPSIKKLVPNIPRDLETIINKLTRYEPSERYESGLDAADDLQRFLDGRSIRARRTTTLERTWKWAKRNKALSSALITIFCLLAGFAGFAQYGKVRLTTLLKQSQTATEKANTNLMLATNLLDKTLESYTEQSITTTLALPGAQSTEVKVDTPFTVADAERLNQLLTFYERLSASNQNQTDLIKKVAFAKGRIGEIYHQLGQWDSADNTFQNTINWIKDHKSSIDKMPKEEQNEILVFYAKTLDQIGRVKLWNGNHKEAMEHHRRSIKALSALQGYPANQEAETSRRYQLATSRLLLATVPIKINHQFIQIRKQPKGFFNRGKRARQRATPSAKNRMQRNARRIAAGRSEAQRKKELDEGYQTLKLALKNFLSLQKDYPEEPKYQIGLASCYLNLSILEEIKGKKKWKGKNGAPSPSADPFEKSLDLLKNLTEKFPENVAYQYELASALARSRSRMPHRRTIEKLRQANEIALALKERFPTNFQFHLLCSSIDGEIGELEARGKNWKTAEEHLVQAIDQLELVSKELSDPASLNVPIARLELRLVDLWTHRSFYSVHSSVAQDPEAYLKKVISRFPEEEISDVPDNNVARQIVGQAYGKLIEYYVSVGRPGKAKRLRDRVEKFRRESEPRGPRRPIFKREAGPKTQPNRSRTKSSKNR